MKAKQIIVFFILNFSTIVTFAQNNNLLKDINESGKVLNELIKTIKPKKEQMQQISENEFCITNQTDSTINCELIFNDETIAEIVAGTNQSACVYEIETAIYTFVCRNKNGVIRKSQIKFEGGKMEEVIK